MACESGGRRKRIRTVTAARGRQASGQGDNCGLNQVEMPEVARLPGNPLNLRQIVDSFPPLAVQEEARF